MNENNNNGFVLSTISIHSYRSETKFVALKTTSSLVRTKSGVFRQPGDFKTFSNSLSVSCKTFAGHMSTYELKPLYRENLRKQKTG
jgi:hypothetical protein